MQKIIIAFILSAFSFQAIAQHKQRCATEEKVLESTVNSEKYNEFRNDLERRTAEWISSESVERSQAVITIPIVIHVVYRLGWENIPDAQILSQIAVINEDFRRRNSDTANTPLPFAVAASDAEIEFCLAERDPQGNPTNGITRTQTTIVRIGNTSNYYKTASGGKDIWDRNKYMNIWVCDIDGGSTLGFAYYPGSASAQYDGIVIDFRNFGTVGNIAPPYDLGRTATHEIGHWFNLRHIWGDSSCGSDQVGDTPAQEGPNWDCPSFPLSTNCPGSTPDGQMFMNYMDYTDDGCMNTFTLGQKNRMRAAINSSRSGLLTSNGCITVGTEKRTSVSMENIFPNPTQGTVHLQNLAGKGSTNISVFDFAGQLVYSEEIFSDGGDVKLDLSFLSAGFYFLNINSHINSAPAKFAIIK